MSRYLNDASIIFPEISFSFYQSVPNLLTGLGILGTFIGLAFGVGAASSGLASSMPSEITASLQQLLDGASLAFLTSICGISSSILFVPVLRTCSRQLHLDVNRWVGTLEAGLGVSRLRVSPSISLNRRDGRQSRSRGSTRTSCSPSRTRLKRRSLAASLPRSSASSKPFKRSVRIGRLKPEN